MKTAPVQCTATARRAGTRARHAAVASGTLTSVMTGKPARGIVNRAMRELGPMRGDVPQFPLASGAMAPLRAAAEQRGSGDFSPLWSGQNASQCRAMSAAELTRAFFGPGTF